ncbi:pentatricopeptide repeat-containing protein At1g15480, mitochondrial [Arabidopsis lyrata subsp. lyrata]|uniref:pentatricopeptide repeat-containing protein At1g15480, mitochondrial n=1 Tax=Arabidopsis lyrata subsp. lyrata TaxID=81972 RepID=UPI000A29BE1E|nr:pentatricopeptide repeat-containing protein At1g15480, mitochondrial [Arabidopsis lyrata subsp. lyrata]|eukprot:XP_020866818.1 pentatricopeptide repeat-containing protein At1g15480, mitochondrial [Arabidopsis lyrata subsp. lyrata]
MCEQRVFNVFPEDYAARLNLVETVLGLEEAEKFFERIPENMRDYSVYENLLRSYTKSEKTLDKAEDTFEKMRDLGFLSKPSPFDTMISLYRKLNKRDMVKKLKYEMMENNVKIDRPIELNVLSIVSDFKRDYLDPLWNKYKKEGKLMDDEYRIRISYLLKLDDVQGAEKIYQKWQPTGPKLDMSVPGLLISRFRAEGNESKVEEMVNSIRMKRIVMHLATLTLPLINLGLTIVVLAIMGAIITAIVKCNVWLFQQYPLLCVLFCGHIIQEYPILFASIFFCIISSY